MSVSVTPELFLLLVVATPEVVIVPVTPVTPPAVADSAPVGLITALLISFKLPSAFVIVPL